MIHRRIVVSGLLLSISVLHLSSLCAVGDEFPLVNGDRICIIGNALAERMQHDGWLETMIQARFPDRELVFRNLGFSGDEANERLRSAGFGSPDDWLTHCKGDVVFAFFGYNESFAGEAGLNKFKQDLENFIEHTREQKYNGTSAPRLVLFSPIAFENLKSTHLPDGTLHNARLQSYTCIMSDVAKVHDVPFVDLFHATQKLYSQIQKPLTINGVHLNSLGNRYVALAIGEALFPDTPLIEIDESYYEGLRRSVQDKNFPWFHRYRTTDGYNVFGGRSYLKYTDDISNRAVMQREMEILDVMTANRDRRVWALAQGRGHFKVDDSNTPDFIAVKTNMPGPLEGGKHIFLGGEEAIGKMQVAEGMKVELFASEEQFPQLINPVQMSFDTRGRLWVAAWTSYPHWKPKDKMDDKLLVLEDTDGDGRADQCKTFAGGLHNPTGFEFWGGGVFVAMVPDLLFLKDTDGDDVADVRERVLHGLDSADTHHAANSFVLDPGGALYFQEGVFHQSQIETVYEGAMRNNNACVWRFNPRTWDVDRYIPYDFANPHGHLFDRWGEGFVHDATSARPWHDTAFSGHIDHPQKHPASPQLYQQRTRPCAATEILSSGHFPERNQGNLLVANVIGFQGILQYKIEETDSSFAGVEIEPILFSSDPSFRPVDIEIGPDGSIFFTDWQNPIIGHMQHHIRDPNRDRKHGRVYRVTYEGRPLLAPPQIAGQPIDKLLELLKQPEDRVRYLTRIELSGRDTTEVIAAVTRWIKTLDECDADYEHHIMEALWVHQQHNVVNEPLLRRMLRSPDDHARSAATRVLCYWRDGLADPLVLLNTQANDEHPRVRLEAVRACSFFRDARAAEAALECLKHPLDEFLNFTLTETIKQLEPYWKKALADRTALAADNQAGMNYLLDSVSSAELLTLPRSTAVYQALLARPNILHDARHDALMALAELRETDMMTELLSAIQRLDKSESPAARIVLADLAHMLTSQSPVDFAKYRDRIEQLAQDAHRPITRRIALVTLITADDSIEPTWQLASRSLKGLKDFAESVPLIPDARLRAAANPKLEPLLHGLPEPLASSADDDNNKHDAAETIRRAAIDAITYTGTNETRTFQTLAHFVLADKSRAEAVRALLRIPRRAWPENQLQPLINNIAERVSALPANERTEPTALDELALGNKLASALPKPQAEMARKALGELSVNVIVLRPVPHKMRYDRTQVFVEAGKPVEIVLENVDVMPHNLVITQPGELATVGMAAERMATQPDAFERQFIPDLPQVLAATNLLQPSQTERLSFIAPAEHGDFPYVCTFPGHWRTMYGTMHVVKSLDDVPLEALAPAADPEIQSRPFVRDWRIDDLAGDLAEAGSGRNFERAKELFTELSCIKCHRMNGQGGEVGPDLAGVKKKLAAHEFTRPDILQELIEPSAKIDPKYKTIVLQDTKGRVYTGITAERNDEHVKLVSNPLDDTPPAVIPISEIDDEFESQVSLMPGGLLNTLTKEEILDLLTYLESAGDPNHPAFE